MSDAPMISVRGEAVLEAEPETQIVRAAVEARFTATQPDLGQR
jgi:hypothetical protein